MAAYRFLIADVFSDQAFGGNQLAILPDARAITDEGLQAVTREFNFAESTFVLPAGSAAAARRVRIFTPGRELPFAGHPTVGTACALVKEGIAQPGDFTIEEGIGPVAVRVERDGESFSARFAVDRAPVLHPDPTTPAEAAAAISLDEADVVQVVAAGLGVDFTFVRLRDRETVDRAKLDQAAWSRAFAGKVADQIYLFAGDLADGGDIYARMFGPSLGISEDPATGSAAGILAGVAAGLAGQAVDRFSLSISQGVAMGRPSKIQSCARLRNAEVVGFEVGGSVTFVAEGQIDIPPRYLLD